MIRLVSLSRLLPFNSTGSPTLASTVGGSVTLSTLGTREERGHTFSVPHNPTGMTGTGHLREPGRTPPALQLRVEEGRPAGDGALGHDRDHLAGTERLGRELQRLVGSGAAVDADAAHRRGDLPDDRGTSNTSFLPRKRTVRPVFAITIAITIGSK